MSTPTRAFATSKFRKRSHATSATAIAAFMPKSSKAARSRRATISKSHEAQTPERASVRGSRSDPSSRRVGDHGGSRGRLVGPTAPGIAPPLVVGPDAVGSPATELQAGELVPLNYVRGSSGAAPQVALVWV